MVSSMSGVITLVVVCLTLGQALVHGQENSTVIGPVNVDLAAGVEALRAGDGREAVRRTMIGLNFAGSTREKVAAMSNLCAAHILLAEYEVAVSWCDQAVVLAPENWQAQSNRALALIKLGRYVEAEDALGKAEALATDARTVRSVRAMLLDATAPVTPHIQIDDRRQGPDDNPG